MSESEMSAVGAAIVSEVVEGAVEAAVSDEPKARVRNSGSGKLNKKALGVFLAFEWVERLAESDRAMYETVLRQSTVDSAEGVRALFERLAPAKRAASVAGPGSRAPRAIQPPKVEGAEGLFKMYHVERVGVFMVGHANTAKGWVTRSLVDNSTERHGDLKAGKAAAVAYAVEHSPKTENGKGAKAAIAAFEARTVKDGKYGLVADGRMAGAGTVAASE